MRSDDKEQTLGRRDLLGALGVAAAGAAIGGGLGAALRVPRPEPRPPTSRAINKPPVPGAARFRTGEETWIATSCGACERACATRVRVIEGRAVRIEGNRLHPVTGGGLGPRGLSALQSLYARDAIAQPLVRRDGRLEPSDWDAALVRVGSALAGTRARAPERVVVIRGSRGGVESELVDRFCRAYGTPNLVTLGDDVLAQAMGASTGKRVDPVFQWDHATCVLSLESGLFESSCPSPYLARMTADMRRGDRARDGRVIHASAAFDLTAQVVDTWLPMEPGTSGALALGLAQILIRDGLYDAAYVADYTTGFNDFARWVATELPLDRVAAITGLSRRSIERLARDLATHRPSFAYVDARSLAFDNGLDTARAVLALNALLGALGASVRAPVEAPLADWAEPEIDAAALAGLASPRLDRAGTEELPFASSSPRALLAAMEAAPPEVVILDHANLLHGEAASERWAAVLGRVPLVASITSVLDETASRAAHVVLPAATPLERWDLVRVPEVGYPAVNLRRPAVAPPRDTRAPGAVLIELARRIGGTVARAFSFRDVREAVLERARGAFEVRRGTLVEPTERAFFRRLEEAGFWADPESRPTSTLPFAFAASYAEPSWQGEACDYPLRLVAQHSLGSGGENEPSLRRLRVRPDAPHAAMIASLHPDSAGGIAQGDPITIASAFGSIEAVARLDERIARDVIVVPLGAGHEGIGRWASGRGSDATRLLAPQAAPRTGASPTCTTRVRVTKRSRV